MRFTLFAVLIFGACALLQAQAPYQYTLAELKVRLPEPVCDSHPGYVDLYWKAWELAQKNIQANPDTTVNGLTPYWMDEAYENLSLFQWDTEFMMMFGRFGWYMWPSIVSLDNFYRKQWGNGRIDRGIAVSNGSSGSGQNPPLFAWSEWEHYRLTADSARLRVVLPALIRYFDWIRSSLRRVDGAYYWSNYESGMDNSPREQNYVAGGRPAAWGWVDLTAQQALSADYISRIARETGNSAAADSFSAIRDGLNAFLNSGFWDNGSNFYYDRAQSGTLTNIKTIASFWPVLCGAADSSRYNGLKLRHLTNPDEFWTPHVTPSLSADDLQYNTSGDYWRGSVWAPTTYMVAKGCERMGDDILATAIAMNHLDNMSAVFKSTGTIWENYAPASASRGSTSKRGFVGWTGCGPISLLTENVIGIRPQAQRDSLFWNMTLLEKHGMRNLHFGDNIASVIGDSRNSDLDSVKINVQTDNTFKLTCKINGRLFTRAIPVGSTLWDLGAPVLNSAVVIHDTLEQYLQKPLKLSVTWAGITETTTAYRNLFATLDPSIVSVSTEGLMKGLTLGTGRIRINRGAFLSPETITVAVVQSTAILDSLRVEWEADTVFLNHWKPGGYLKTYGPVKGLAVGDSFQVHAMGYFHENGQAFTRSMDNYATWTSSANSALSVDKGKAKALAPSAQYIRVFAQYGGLSDTAFFASCGQLKRINFGPEGTPYSQGWLAENEGGGYSVARGYGWQSQSALSSRYRGGKNYLQGTFCGNSDTLPNYRIKVPDGSYVIRIGMGDNEWGGDSPIWVAFGSDTLYKHAAGKINYNETDTVTVSGGNGLAMNINGAMNYLVLMSQDGTDINAVADDETPFIMPGSGTAIKDIPGEDGQNTGTGLTAIPNPFNPALTITLPLRFAIRKLTVYDIRGKEVADLLPAVKNGRVTWKPALPSGLYILKAKSANRQWVKRVVLAK